MNFSRPIRYGAAALLALAAALLRSYLDPVIGGNVPFTTYYLAIMVAAWVGGYGPGLLAVVISLLTELLFFIAPADGLLPMATSDWTAVLLFAAIGLAISWLGGRAHAWASSLQQQRERFRVTLSSIGDGVIVTDTDARVTFINPIAESLTGWAARDAIGQLLPQVFPIENELSGEPANNPVDDVLRSGRIVGLANHTILIARDGKRHAIDDSAAPIRDDNGRLSGVVLVFRDVSEKRQLETARSRLAAVVESSEDAIIGQTLEAQVTDWNAAAERLFGFSASEAVGRPVFDTIVPADRRQELLDALATVANGERVPPFLTQRHTKDGRTIPVSLALSPIRNSEGEIIGAAAIDRDMTQHLVAERRRNARLAITQTLAEADSLDTAAPRIIQIVCQALDWDAGVFWLLDRDGGKLQATTYWQKPELTSTRFQELTMDTAFERDQSLPGRVWQAGEPVWLADVAADPHFLRRDAASADDLHGAFGMPICIGGRFLGVMEFFSREIRQPDEDLLEMATTIGGQVGQFIERRETEADLVRSEQQLSDFFENAAIGLHWVGPDGTVLRVNKAELDMLGYTADEYVGRHIAEFHADEPVIDNILHTLTSGGELKDHEARLRCKDGSIRHVLIDSNVYRENGQFIHTRCFTRDITDRKDLEAELRRQVEALTEAEARIRSVVDHVMDGIITMDEEGVVASYNLAAERIFGYRAEEVIGNNVRMLMPEPYRSGHDQYLRNDRRTGEAKVIGIGREVMGQRKDGSTFPLDLAVGEFRHGERRLFTGIVRDITQRKHTEQSLRFLAEASRSLATLSDYRSTLKRVAQLAVPGYADWCAVHVLDEHGELSRLTIAHADHGRIELAEELYRRYPSTADDPHGPSRVVRTREPELVEEIPDELLQESARDVEHLEILRRLGLKSYLCVPLMMNERVIGTLTFVSGESGRRYGPADLEMAEDLAHRASIAIENARLYQELHEADRRKDEFLAMLAHELRNPLAPIRTGLEILALEDDQHGRLIETMQRQVIHVVRLVDDLLDVSRIMRGRVELRKERVALAEIVSRATQVLRPQIEKSGQQLEVSVPDEPIWVQADPVRLVQVIENLLSNANKYSDERGVVSLAVTADDDQTRIVVRDTGIGIEPELLPRIFDLFTQSSRSLDRAQGGLGIGLTLVKRLVEMHGGSVRAHSEGVGKGSKFTVTLPVSGPPETSSPQAEGDTRDARSVLIVDDNIEAARMLCLLLTTIGDHRVEMAHDGPGGLEHALRMRPDILLLDIGLPGMDGYEVAERLRADERMDDMLLVALTGYGQAEDRRRAQEAGFDEHVVKPPSLQQIRAVLDHPKLARN